MSARDVLVVGNLRGASRSALTTAVNSLDLNITEIANIEEAMAALETRHWKAVLVDTTLSGASRFCTEARSHRNLFGIPFIALSPRLTDLAFLNALRWGADDVVALGAAEALSVRLAPLLDVPPNADVSADRGEAVVADPDRRRGNGLGRAVHTAGYSVRYATDTTSARFYTTKNEIQLFILSAELADPKSFIQEAQQGGCAARWVVLAKAAQIDELQKELTPLKGVVVMTAGGPPENVAFAINLLYPSEASRRGEIRALFGTVVYFRAVGDYRDECGFSYTASPQGLYVRTLAPPPSDKVWVELIPPDGERRVRLVGKVAWSRSYGRQAGEPSPPGFGVRIVDGLGEDLALWSECLKGLEFRAPATLVPEARFSLPAPPRAAPAGAPVSAQGNAIRKAPTPVSLSPVLLSNPSLSRAQPSIRTSDDEPSNVAPSVPQPPISTSIDRLSAAAKARISTRPSLRLSIPGPASIRKEPLAKPNKTSPSLTELVAQPPAEPATGPKRVGQGRTVMGLGILQRDGSLVFGSRASDLPPEPAPTDERSNTHANNPTPLDVDPSESFRRAATTSSSPAEAPHAERPEPARLSPITGRTLSYGSEPPLASDNKFQAAADALPYAPEDISDRPTLADRMSLQLAEQFAAESLTPAAPEVFDSLPPDALEFDAPTTGPLAPPRRTDGISKTLLAATPALPLGTELPGPEQSDAEPLGAGPSGTGPSAPELAETDRNWVGLDVIPPEHQLSEPARDGNEHSLARQTPTESVTREVEPDLGATLPGVVVDTRSDNQSNHRNEGLANSEPTPHAYSRPERSPEVRSVQHEFASGDDLEPSGLPRKQGRALWPLLAAVVVASGLVALLVKPSGEPKVSDSSPPEASPDSAHLHAVGTVAGTAVTPAPTVVGPAFTASPSVSPALAPASVVAPSTASSSAALTPAEPNDATQNLPASTDAPAADSNPPRDPASLSPKNAWLFVQSPVAARVFVHGVDSGVTNTWLETPCGTRFVRLGRAAGDWMSPGVPIIIRCRSANTVEVPAD